MEANLRRLRDWEIRRDELPDRTEIGCFSEIGTRNFVICRRNDRDR